MCHRQIVKEGDREPLPCHLPSASAQLGQQPIVRGREAMGPEAASVVGWARVG